MPTIPYIIALPEDIGSPTFFQHFSLVGIKASIAISFIASELPACTEELDKSRDEIILHRSQDDWNFLLQRGPVTALKKLLSMLPKELPLVVYAESSVLEEAKLQAQGRSALIKSFTINEEWNFSTDLTRQDVINYIGNGVAKSERPTVRIIDLVYTHNATRPNLACMEAVGYKFENEKPLIKPFLEDYGTPIATSAALVDSERIRVGSRRSRIIVASPTINWELFTEHKKLPFKIAPNDPVARQVARNFLRRSAYSQQIKLPDGVDLNQVFGKGLGYLLTHFRNLELSAFTNILSAKSISSFTPVYRLPELQGDLYGKLSDLGRAAGSHAATHIKRKKLNKCALEVSQKFRGLVPNALAESILKNRDHITLIGDIPLELLNAGGAPLTAVCTISRIPPIPGELFVRHGLRESYVHFTTESLKKILVVRSFTETDDRSELAVKSMRSAAQALGSNVDLTVKDVRTVKEFIEVLSSFDGHIAIFDGHGHYDFSTGASSLKVGNELLDPMDLDGDINVPPIVFLSACNTHALHGSQLSVVNGLLNLGAFSVVGTTVPITFSEAAIFLARLIALIDQVVAQNSGVITWAEVVGAVVKLSHIQEVTFALAEKYKIDPKILEWTAMSAMSSAFNKKDWLDPYIIQVSETLNCTPTEVKKSMQELAYFTHAASYVHFGMPDLVLIHSEISPPESDIEAAALEK